jgi:hypothetical protein
MFHRHIAISENLRLMMQSDQVLNFDALTNLDLKIKLFWTFEIILIIVGIFALGKIIQRIKNHQRL